MERITKQRVRKGGTVEFLVRWADYGPSDDSWEPKRNLGDDCPQVVRAWELEKAGRKEEAEAVLRESSESVDEGRYDDDHHHSDAAAATRWEMKGCSDGPTGPETLRYLIQEFLYPIISASY